MPQRQMTASHLSCSGDSAVHGMHRLAGRVDGCPAGHPGHGVRLKGRFRGTIPGALPRGTSGGTSGGHFRGQQVWQ